MTAHRMALVLAALVSAACLVAPLALLASESTDAQSVKWFARMQLVMKSPRCINCHSEDDFPHQGDDHHRHDQNVVRSSVQRGEGVSGPGAGATTVPCSSCHQATNSADGKVPGAPNWQFVPSPLGWDRVSGGALCRRLLDPLVNGNRTPQDILKHTQTDPLVNWAFNPGGNRTKPPLSKADFVEAVRQWGLTGAKCPK